MIEEKAIERLNDLIHTCDAGIKEHGEYDDFFKEDKEAIKTVLNMLKEKGEQIAKYEKIYKEYDCYRWIKELNKKDKIIDLMAEEINNAVLKVCPYIDYGIDLDCENRCDDNSKECWKQYFKSKAEKE